MTLVERRLDFSDKKDLMNDRFHSVEIIYFSYFLNLFVIDLLKKNTNSKIKVK